MKKSLASVFMALVCAGLSIDARQSGLVAAPDRRPGEGAGPFPTLTIRNVMVIDGTGAPPVGPVNVVIEHNRIARITSAGTPGVPPREPAPAPAGPNVIDGTGMYLMPGFVNLHAHLGDNRRRRREAEYVYKLYMAHGVTTDARRRAGAAAVRAEGEGAQRRRTRSSRRASSTISGRARAGAKGVVDTPEKARAWVRWCAANGVDGMKLVAYPPRHHGGAARRGEEARPRIDRAPRAARRRADERADRGEARARHGHALLRALRSAAARLPSAAVARPDELQRRAVPLRPGGAAVGSDPSARQPRVEGVPAGAHQARHDLRSDDDGVRRRPRRDAHAQRRLARASTRCRR